MYSCGHGKASTRSGKHLHIALGPMPTPGTNLIPKRVEAKALTGVMRALPEDDTERFKPFMDKESFKRWLTETVFGSTCEQPAGSPAC